MLGWRRRAVAGRERRGGKTKSCTPLAASSAARRIPGSRDEIEPSDECIAGTEAPRARLGPADPRVVSPERKEERSRGGGGGGRGAEATAAAAAPTPLSIFFANRPQSSPCPPPPPQP